MYLIDSKKVFLYYNGVPRLRIGKVIKLRETIISLEGTPRKTKMQPEFEVWLKSIDHTQRTRVIKRMMFIHQCGLYGKKTHVLFDLCPGLYEIFFDDQLRIYFSVDEPLISLEDGSHSKSGGTKTGSQQRVIDRVSKRLKEEQYSNVNKQWYEEFVTPTDLLISFFSNDPAFDDVTENDKNEIIFEIVKIISERTGETPEEILNF
ncbi:hypothetical protein [Treponema sp. R8-4-B8]